MHDDPLLRKEYSERRLWIAIHYRSPWEALSERLWRLDPVTGEPGHPIRCGGLRERLATWVEARDFAWRDRYARLGETPSDRWSRKRDSSKRKTND